MCREVSTAMGARRDWKASKAISSNDWKVSRGRRSTGCGKASRHWKAGRGRRSMGCSKASRHWKLSKGKSVQVAAKKQAEAAKWVREEEIRGLARVKRKIYKLEEEMSKAYWWICRIAKFCKRQQVWRKPYSLIKVRKGKKLGASVGAWNKKSNSGQSLHVEEDWTY
jgi:hypothetical protein